MDLTSTKPARPSRAEALALLGAEPLALAPSTLRTLAADGTMWGWDDEDEPEAYQIVGDLAVITIRGCLWQRGCWWWSGYDTIEASLSKALLDGRVKSVVLAIDSPGGVVAGLFAGALAQGAEVEPAFCVFDQQLQRQRVGALPLAGARGQQADDVADVVQPVARLLLRTQAEVLQQQRHCGAKH